LIAYIANDEDYGQFLAGKEMKCAVLFRHYFMGCAFDMYRGAGQTRARLLIVYFTADGDVARILGAGGKDHKRQQPNKN
jgi:hypothetical protein